MKPFQPIKLNTRVSNYITVVAEFGPKKMYIEALGDNGDAGWMIWIPQIVGVAWRKALKGKRVHRTHTERTRSAALKFARRILREAGFAHAEADEYQLPLHLHFDRLPAVDEIESMTKAACLKLKPGAILQIKIDKGGWDPQPAQLAIVEVPPCKIDANMSVRVKYDAHLHFISHKNVVAHLGYVFDALDELMVLNHEQNQPNESAVCC